MRMFKGITAGLVFAAVLSACGGGGGGNNNSTSSPTTPPPTETVPLLSGTVTNSVTKQGVAGASVELKSSSTTETLTTDAQGKYSSNDALPGAYTLTVSADNYTTSTPQQINLVEGSPAVVDVALEPTAKVTVSIEYSGPVEPGAALTATGTYAILDGSEFVSAKWEPITDSEGIPEGLEPAVSDPNSTTPTITMDSASDYAAYLVQVLKNPPITKADLPPDLNLQPINEIQKGMQNRNQAVAIDPMAMEKADGGPVEVHGHDEFRHVFVSSRTCETALGREHRRENRAGGCASSVIRQG